MKKPDRVIARNARNLMRVLALDPAYDIEIEVRSSLVDRISAAVAERRLTHAQVAKLAHTSRTRARLIASAQRNLRDARIAASRTVRLAIESGDTAPGRCPSPA